MLMITLFPAKKDLLKLILQCSGRSDLSVVILEQVRLADL